MREIALAGATGTSRILLGVSLEDLGEFVDPGRTILLMDADVARLHPGLAPGFERIDAGSGESAKSLENVGRICRGLLELGADRSSMVVGVGGGAVCDVAGLAASLFMRGIRFGLAPTSLLAQADAAIGGKNGVNLDGYKNVIGVFAQPAFVFVDFEILRTLPPREILCGAAEIVKHALIGDAAMFGYLERNGGRLLALERDAVVEAVGRSVALKKTIVEADERESGGRRKLNFGHTLAHALEKTAGVSHGEAVAMGMAFACRVSAVRGLLSATDTARIEALLRAMGLPSDAPQAPADLLAAAVRKDKKRDGETLRFVLLEGIGKARVVELSLNELEGYIHGLC